MKISMIILALLLCGCGPTVKQSYTSPTYIKVCQALCEEKFNTNAESVGVLDGTCYCQ